MPITLDPVLSHNDLATIKTLVLGILSDRTKNITNFYIGITDDLNTRKGQHEQEEIAWTHMKSLCQSSRERARELEISLISYMKDTIKDPRLFNKNRGGGGSGEPQDLCYVYFLYKTSPSSRWSSPSSY